MTLQEVNVDHPVAKFIPNRDYIYSKGWNLNDGHVNSDGFVNEQNYDPLSQRPLLAVVGDSYVEALMVPYREPCKAACPPRSETEAASTASEGRARR